MTTLRTLISADQLAARVAALGAELSSHYAGQSVVVVGVLTGSFVFVADLVRAMPDVDLVVDWIGASSYAGTSTTGTVTLSRDVTTPLRGRHVLVVEDIIDTGLTLTRLLAHLHAQAPASLRIATLLDKPSRRRAPVQPHHVGFTVEDRFVVGYGLDLDGRFRHLPYVGEVVSDTA